MEASFIIDIHTCKRLFCSYCFCKSVRRFFSDRVKRFVLYTLVCMSLLCMHREDRTKQILFLGRKFSFPYVDIQSDVPKCKFILKNKNFRIFIVFPPIKSFKKGGGETSPRSFSKKSTLSLSVDKQSKILYRYLLLYIQVGDCQNISKLKVLVNYFYLT